MDAQMERIIGAYARGLVTAGEFADMVAERAAVLDRELLARAVVAGTA